MTHFTGKGRDGTSPCISLHRFGDTGAIAMLGNPEGGTLYMKAKEVRALARELARLARSLERQSFQHSDYGRGRVTAGEHHTKGE